MFNMARLIVIGEATKAPGVSSTTLPLSVRERVCPEYSMKHDRDRNGRDQPEESRREFYGVCL